MQFSWVYILASQKNGTLYTGVTSSLENRIWQHRHDMFPGFSRKYGCKTLVWYETHSDIEEAFVREKRIKRWKRAWKIKLITDVNPEWDDLYTALIATPAESIVPEAAQLLSGAGWN